MNCTFFRKKFLKFDSTKKRCAIFEEKFLKYSTMKTNQIMIREDNSFTQRTKDGYFDATLLINSWNANCDFKDRKVLSKYRINKGTKEFIEQLGVFAEIFMILGVVTPLFLIVIIAILSVIANAAVNVGQMFIVGLTYFVLPFFMIAMLLLLSTASREI